ncbi:MAG: protein kinase [Planctomycetes bacterium]|nr:protein kinase [Planctomycetota bacterium]
MTKSRLELAVQVWLEHRSDGTAPQDLLDAHPDLRDLLEPMLSGDADASIELDGRSFGDFDLVRELGRGGMGVVWLARQKSLDRDVALKLLPEDPLRDAASIARFKREALAASRLDHPNIVKVIAVGDVDGTHYIAMEYVDGQPLGSQRLAIDDIVNIGIQVADALDIAHHEGIVHRDVKPSNILLRADGTPVLSDFGLARSDSLPSLTRSGAFAGTPGYSSPEQVEGKPVDARSDVFSLGTTLYEALTGRRAFDGPSDAAILDAVRRHDPIEPHRRTPRVPLELSAVVMRAIQKDPVHRYQSAEALADDLRAYRSGRPTVAKPSTALGRARKWARREPMRATLVTALAILLPTLGGLATYLITKAPVWRATEERLRSETIEAFVAEAFRGLLSLEGSAVVHDRCARVLEFDALQPDAIGCLALLELRDHGNEASVASLRGHRAALAQSLSLRELESQLTNDQTRSTPKSALGALLVGLASAMHPETKGIGFTEDAQIPALRQAADLIDLASRLTPRPRLAYYEQLVYAACSARNAPQARRAAAVLERLWPSDDGARHAIAAAVSIEDPPRGAELLRQYLATHDDDATARFQLVCVLRTVKQTDAALREARKLGAQLPNNATAQRALAECLDIAPDRTEVIAAWRRVLELDPKDAGAAYNLGTELSETDDIDETIRLYRLAIELDPSMADAHCNLGLAWMRADRLAEAIEQFRASIAIDPMHRQAHANLIAAARRGKDIALQIAERKRWTTVCPQDHQGWIQLGALYLEEPSPERVRDPVAAMHAGLEALYACRGREANPWKFVAYCWAQLGNRAAAEQTIRLAMSALPGSEAELQVELERYATVR